MDAIKLEQMPLANCIQFETDLYDVNRPEDFMTLLALNIYEIVKNDDSISTDFKLVITPTTRGCLSTNYPIHVDMYLAHRPESSILNISIPVLRPFSHVSDKRYCDRQIIDIYRRYIEDLTKYMCNKEFVSPINEGDVFKISRNKFYDRMSETDDEDCYDDKVKIEITQISDVIRYDLFDTTNLDMYNFDRSMSYTRLINITHNATKLEKEE